MTPSEAASIPLSPASFLAAIFSAMTMASSTKRPKTKTRETRVTVFIGIEKNLKSIKDPRKERGIPIPVQKQRKGVRKREGQERQKENLRLYLLSE